MIKNIWSPIFKVSLLMIFISSNSGSECQTKTTGVKEGVRNMAYEIVRDLHNEGPISWLKYFSNSRQFYMASDGQLVFPNYDTADVFVRMFAKQVKQIDLTWSDIRIDSLSPDLGNLAASFHEILIRTGGIQDTSAGYFTGVVENTPTGWKLRDAHWSIIHSKH